jgi:hypothetical protein
VSGLQILVVRSTSKVVVNCKIHDDEDSRTSDASEEPDVDAIGAVACSTIAARIPSLSAPLMVATTARCLMKRNVGIAVIPYFFVTSGSLSVSTLTNVT